MINGSFDRRFVDEHAVNKASRGSAPWRRQPSRCELGTSIPRRDVARDASRLVHGEDLRYIGIGFALAADKKARELGCIV